MRVLLVLAGLLVIAMVAALAYGPATSGLFDAMRALIGLGDPHVVAVVQEVRLPRVLLGVLVGGTLGLSGAALQGLLRNPLADPGVIGVSASAAFGAVLVLYFGLAALSPFVLPVAAIGFAMLATFALYLVASRDASVVTLILAGVAISSLMNALTSLAINLSPNPYSMSEIVLWLFGSLNNRGMSDVLVAAPFIVAGGAMLLMAGRSLDALLLGEDAASSLGVDLRRLRRLIIVGTALAVGASVAATGAVGFVGLIVPHLVRPFVGYQPSRALLPSALAGALLLVLADLGIRALPGAQELKLGVVTALIGAPFFFHLLIATRRRMR
ncbi:FecCD family ABC transporter permease [Govanella unica]|uniref:Iron ABC transporter permease n=1 Tax=Govanella unica TaxID=2975056 RepID=A0A9X3Z791_9PROT|nr:iron ABC transporter permease [Govania unica]MDA5193921.1 iron ABC transporter permease [Govania unica]